jgi:C4-dicarboxylate-binding protein DctP
MLKRIIGITVSVIMCLIVFVGCGVPTKIGENKRQTNAIDEKNSNIPSIESKYKDVQPKYKLRLSLQDAASDNREFHAATVFRDYVEAQTNGKVQVQVFPGAQLGKEREIFEAIIAGNVDMGMITDGPMSGFIPEISVLSIPYIFRSAPVAWEVMDGQFGRELREHVFNKTGVRILNVAENGFRCFTNNGKPIKTLEDMSGLKFRVMENQMYVTMIRALGAQAVPMAGGEELYSALEQKVIDGQENPLDIIDTFRLYEVQDYITVDNHTYSSKWLCINDKKLSSMPPEYQNVIKDAGVIWKTQLQGPKEAVANQAFFTLKEKVKEVYTLPDTEKERFRSASQQPVIDWMKEQIDAQWIAKLQKAIVDAEKKIQQ